MNTSTAPLQTSAAALSLSASQHAPMHRPKRLQWQLALLNSATLGVVLSISGYITDAAAPSSVALLVYCAVAGLIVGVGTLWLLRRALKPLSAISDFVQQLPTFSPAQLSPPSAFEFQQLTDALNLTAKKLRLHDAAVSRAINDLEERQLALDQHAIISVLNLNGQFQDANDLLCQISGYARHELINHSFAMVDPLGKPLEDDLLRWKKLLQGNVWHGEMQLKPRQGAVRWLESTLVPIRDIHGAFHQILCIQNDISERKHSEQGLAANQKALEMMTANMEQLIKERTAELELANDELAHANQVKSEFISIVSHELRTPLTSIKSFADILADEIDDPEAKNYLRIINEEAERLNRLINDILDMQKIDAGRMVWRDEKINLIDVTRAAVESFSGAYSAKGITLRLDVIDAELHVTTDSDKIRQVLANLLSNALKFTQQGKVVVSVRQVGDSDGKRFIQTAVRDNGPGLAASQLERVFEQFYQVENDQSRKVQGTGLGLTICKQIIEHYRGKIWAESELGAGATMLFQLPASEGAHA